MVLYYRQQFMRDIEECKMGKFLKICLSIGIVCVLLGLAASALGISKEGLERLGQEVLNGAWSIGGEDIEPFFELEDSDFFEKEKEIVTVTEYQEQSIAATDINALHIKSAAVVVEVITYDGTDIKVTVENVKKYQNYVKDGVCYVLASGKAVMKDKGAEVHIYIPSALSTAGILDIEAEAAAGVVALGSIWADEVKLEVSAGTIQWTGLYAQTLEVDMTAGTVKGADTAISERTQIRLSAGAFELAGVLGNETEIETQAGSMKLVLNEVYEAYDYEVSCAGGSVKVGEHQADGIAKTMTLQNNAAKHMDIECSAGSVNISFEA